MVARGCGCAHGAHHLAPTPAWCGQWRFQSLILALQICKARVSTEQIYIANTVQIPASWDLYSLAWMQSTTQGQRKHINRLWVEETNRISIASAATNRENPPHWFWALGIFRWPPPRPWGWRHYFDHNVHRRRSIDLDAKTWPRRGNALGHHGFVVRGAG